MGWHLALNSVIGLSTWKSNRNKHGTWRLRLGPWKVWEWVTEKGPEQIKPKLILAKYGNGTNKYIGTCQNAPPSGWYIDRDMHLACSSSSNPFSCQSGKNWRSYGWIFVGWGEKRCWYTLLHRSRHAVLQVCTASKTSIGFQCVTDILVDLYFKLRVHVKWPVASNILVKVPKVPQMSW